MTGIIKNSEFSPLTSATGYALKGIYQWKGKENASALEKGARFVISEVGFVSLALLATVETVIRAAISLVVKLIHYLIPKDKAEWFTKHIYTPTVEATKYTALAAGLAGTSAITNFMDDDSDYLLNSKIGSAWTIGYVFFEKNLEPKHLF